VASLLLGFCHKYHHNPFMPTSLPLFLSKLQDTIESLSNLVSSVSRIYKKQRVSEFVPEGCD